MNFTLTPGLWLDARHGLWMPEERTLVAADLHLGYAWAHRHAGQLLPLSAPEESVERLGALAEEYGARQVVLLGDIVHRAVPVQALREELAALAARLEPARIRWVAGNHDQRLGELLSQCGLRAPLETEVVLGPHLLTHGATEPREPRDGWLIMGHRHPAIHITDRVTTSVKCPCFLAGERVLILPAFSRWAAGGDARPGQRVFTEAYAILGEKILRVALRK